MSNDKEQPIRRLSCKIDGVKYDVGVVWPGKYGGKVRFNLATDTSGKYPKISILDLAQKLVAGEKIFVDEYDNAPRPQGRPSHNAQPGFGDDPDVPF